MWKILNKNESTTVAQGDTYVIPSDGLSEWTHYELSIYVNGAGNHPAELVHQSAAATAFTGYHIPAGGVITIGPVKIEDFPAVRASHGPIDVHISYAIVPREGGD